jgi:dTMP kinase
LEGAGKTTQARRLTERLEAAGVPGLMAREPGGTPGGERVRAVVLDPELDLGGEAELLLYLASRAEFVRQIVRPALREGRVVVADRYELSTLAYQGVARGLGLEAVRELNAWATGGLKPDAVILLRIDPSAGRGRKEEEPDRLERESGEFFGRVSEAYDLLARTEEDVLIVDGGGTPDEVEARVLAELAARWPGTFEVLRR